LGGDVVGPRGGGLGLLEDDCAVIFPSPLIDEATDAAAAVALRSDLPRLCWNSLLSVGEVAPMSTLVTMVVWF